MGKMINLQDIKDIRDVKDIRDIKFQTPWIQKDSGTTENPVKRKDSPVHCGWMKVGRAFSHRYRLVRGRYMCCVKKSYTHGSAP